MSKNVLSRFLRNPLMRDSALWRSRTFCLMSSAFSGVRMVALALPGSGGSAARARASAACLAAWRADQGGAPRRPSLRLRGPSSFAAAPLPVAGLEAAAGFIEAFVTAAAFFVLAMSLSIRCKARECLGFAPDPPRHRLTRPGDESGEMLRANYQS